MRHISAFIALMIGLGLMIAAFTQILSGGLRIEAQEAHHVSFSDTLVLVFLFGWTIYSAGSQLGLWLALNRWIRAVSDYYAGVHDEEK